MTFLAVDDLVCHFPVRGLFGRRTGTVRAVDGVSFALAAGGTLGIVGETGSGKSTLGRAIAGILAPTAGTIRLAGAPLNPRRTRAERALVQYVHQDPGAALDPRWNVGRSLHEPLVIHGVASRAERSARIAAVAGALALAPALFDRHPHALSGGELRRVGLARILVLAPALVVFDEPTAALDTAVAANVLALLADVRTRFGLTAVLISHDIAVVGAICDRVAVMAHGRLVETGPTAAVLAAPRHAATRALLAATPRIGGPRVTDAFVAPPAPGAIPRA